MKNPTATHRAAYNAALAQSGFTKTERDTFAIDQRRTDEQVRTLTWEAAHALDHLQAGDIRRSIERTKAMRALIEDLDPEELSVLTGRLATLLVLARRELAYAKRPILARLLRR